MILNRGFEWSGYTSMAFLSVIPHEVKVAELLPHLDEVSLIILRHVLWNAALPKCLSEEQLSEVARHEPSFAEFWHKRNSLILRRLAGYAAKYENLRLMNWAYNQVSSHENWLFTAVALGGTVRSLRILLKRGLPQDENATTAAARSRDPEILELLLEYNQPYDRQLCLSVARENLNWNIVGHLDPMLVVD